MAHPPRPLFDPMRPPLVLTPKEAGMLLGCSEPTVRRMVRQGRLRGVYLGAGKRGGVLRIRLDDLRALVDLSTMPAPVAEMPGA